MNEWTNEIDWLRSSANDVFKPFPVNRRPLLTVSSSSYSSLSPFFHWQESGESSLTVSISLYNHFFNLLRMSSISTTPLSVTNNGQSHCWAQMVSLQHLKSSTRNFCSGFCDILSLVPLPYCWLFIFFGPPSTQPSNVDAHNSVLSPLPL